MGHDPEYEPRVFGPSSFVSAFENARAQQRVEELIDERMRSFIEYASPVRISGDDRVTENFIHPETRIKHRGYAKGFHLDDPLVYQMFASRLGAVIDRSKQRSSEPDQEAPSAETMLMNAVSTTIMDYFGPPRLGGDRVKARNRFMGGVIMGRPRSISEFRNQGVAACTERASLGHNLCLFAGIPSLFLHGKLSVDGDKKLPHAFQALSLDGKAVIFDPTNHGGVLKGNVFGVRPTIFEIDDLIGFIMGEPEATTLRLEDEDSGNVSEKVLRYTFEPIWPLTFEQLNGLSFSEKYVLSESNNLNERRQQARQEALFLFAALAHEE